MQRDYPAIVRQIERRAGLAAGARDQRMQAVVDALWDGLRERGVSWVGFYLADTGAPESERLVLGPRRDKPACSPIGLQGVCGQSFTSGLVRIVRDVAALGDAYIACDPRDRSEIVLPLFVAPARAGADVGAPERWGVLDVDSWDVGAFDEADAAGLASILRAAGFFTWTRTAPARLDTADGAAGS